MAGSPLLAYIWVSAMLTREYLVILHPSNRDCNHNVLSSHVLAYPLPYGVSECLGCRSACILAPHHSRKAGTVSVVRSALAPHLVTDAGRTRSCCPLARTLEPAGRSRLSTSQYCLRRWCTPPRRCRNTPLCLRVDGPPPWGSALL